MHFFWMANKYQDSTAADQRLHGKLGQVGVVFTVVAAAAPLTVVGDNMLLAMDLGNGRPAVSPPWR
jgi:hypothetical protein